MAANPRRQLALDANVLLDLAEGRDFAHEFREEFQARKYEFFVPPTTAIELHVLSSLGGEPQKSFATTALENLRMWKCQPFALSDTKLALADQFRRRLSELQLIPDEEWNDGLILGETSLADIPILVTSDKHLLDIDDDALLLVFHEADLSPVHPVHPKSLLKALR